MEVDPPLLDDPLDDDPPLDEDDPLPLDEDDPLPLDEDDPPLLDDPLDEAPLPPPHDTEAHSAGTTSGVHPGSLVCG